jgi:hypothetical protein
VSIVGVILLVAAVVLLAAVEWPRLAPRLHLAGRVPQRPHRRSRGHLRVVADDDDPDEFARSVERDLASLPTIDERQHKRR